MTSTPGKFKIHIKLFDFPIIHLQNLPSATYFGCTTIKNGHHPHTYQKSARLHFLHKTAIEAIPNPSLLTVHLLYL